jgi:hypothetical protein
MTYSELMMRMVTSALILNTSDIVHKMGPNKETSLVWAGKDWRQIYPYQIVQISIQELDYVRRLLSPVFPN